MPALLAMSFIALHTCISKTQLNKLKMANQNKNKTASVMGTPFVLCYYGDEWFY